MTSEGESLEGAAGQAKRRCVISRGTRSDVWEFFVKENPVGDGKATVKCTVCGKSYAYHGGTSNLYEHLSRKHPAKLSKALNQVKTEPGTSPRTTSKQVPLTSFVQAVPSAGKPLSAARSNGIDEHLLAWVVEDLRPLNTPSGSGFRRFMAYVEPGYKVPSRTYLTKELKTRHEQGIKALTKTLKDPRIEGIGLTTDIWTSDSTEAYNTVTCHYVHPTDWHLVTSVLETVAFPGSHTGVRIAEFVKSAVRRFSLKSESVVAVVHDEAANVSLAGKSRTFPAHAVLVLLGSMCLAFDVFMLW